MTNPTNPAAASGEAVTDEKIMDIGFKYFKPNPDLNERTKAAYIAAARDCIALAKANPAAGADPMDHAKLEKLGWQRVVCGACGSDMARAQPATSERDAEDARLVALLPGPYYMDPPDGGSVTVMEQLQRMAADAARYRELRNGGRLFVRGDWSGYLGDYKRLTGDELNSEVDAQREQSEKRSGEGGK